MTARALYKIELHYTVNFFVVLLNLFEYLTHPKMFNCHSFRARKKSMAKAAAAVYGDDTPSPEDPTMWDVIDAAADCECPGPPPEFLLPPPPRPPSLQPADPRFCSDDLLTIETCDALPVSFFF